MSISNQSIVNQNYKENEVLVSTVDFHVQSAVSWERSINCYLNVDGCDFMTGTSRDSDMHEKREAYKPVRGVKSLPIFNSFQFFGIGF